MTTYNFNLYKEVYSEGIVFAIIQKLLKQDYTEYSVSEKRYLIADCIKHIDTEKLLTPTLNLLEDFEFITEREAFEQQIDKVISEKDYSADSILKIKAISFSELMSYTLHTKEWGNPKELPKLELTYQSNAVESNLDEVLRYLKRKIYVEVADRNSQLPFHKREQDLKDAIKSMSRIDYENGTKFFAEEKEFFRDLKENLSDSENIQIVQPTENSFPDIFRGSNNKAFLLFKDFLDHHIIDPFVDLSFLYQQLKADNLIHQVKHLQFTNWLKDNDFITGKVFENIIEQGSFRSLRKSSSGHRLNNYQNIKEKHLNARQE